MKSAASPRPGASTEVTEAPIKLEEGWATIYTEGIRPYLEKIDSGVDSAEFEKQSIPATVFSHIYDVIFKMCIQREPENWSDPLYTRYSSSIEDHLKDRAAIALTKQHSVNEVAFLREWVERWQRQLKIVQGLRKMFMYLDRFYVPNNEEVLPLEKKGFTLFKTVIFENFKAIAQACILNAIQKEREGELQDRDLLSAAVKVYVDLGFKLGSEISVYKADLEIAVVEKTRQHYKLVSRNWLNEDSCPDYLLKAENALSQEESRLSSYLHHTTTDPLLIASREELLKVHQKELLEKKSGIDDMLERNASEDLARLYRLYSKVEEGKVPIANSFKEHIKTIGFKLIEQSKAKQAAPGAAASGDGGDDGDKPAPTKAPAKAAPGAKAAAAAKPAAAEVDEHDLIRNLIDLHDRFQDIVKICFSKDQVFEKALKEAFEEFINKEFYVSNLLAKFINAVLTKGSKVQVTDFEKTLDHVVMIYGYIRHKDVFEEKYHSFLANRLLTGKSSSQQAEKSMIAKLKNESGYQWTSKLETMFKDVQRSSDLKEEFTKLIGKDFEEEVNVIVCTAGCWPTASAAPVTLPRELSKICEKFKEFYLTRHSGTKLTWALHQGEAEVVVKFSPKVSRLLIVSTYQMILLLLFNQKRIWKFGDLCEITQIPRKDLITHIMSLAHPKVKVLSKKPMVKEVNDDDEYSINTAFNHERYRVPIKLMKVPTGESESEVSKALLIQRHHQVDAAIVRVMKTSQRLHHNVLVTEVMKQLHRFKPDASYIKKRIESLIEADYLERDETDRRIYNYLA